MNDLKVLEILRMVRGDADCNEDYDLVNDCEEAFKEIEALQAPRTCDKCEYVTYFSPHDSLECGNKDCSFYGMDVDFTDGCNKHKPKAQS